MGGRLIYSCLVCLWNEQKSVSRLEQKFGYIINCTFSLIHVPPCSISPEDPTRKFAELVLSCKLALEKKSLKDALNCDIMPLSQNNTEWSSYLTLTSLIKVLILIASCYHKQAMSENNWRKILEVVSNILTFSLFNLQILRTITNKHHSFIFIVY